MRDPYPDKRQQKAMTFINYAEKYIAACRQAYPDAERDMPESWTSTRSIDLQFERQPDGISCGLFVTLYIKRALAGEVLTNINMTDIENLRRSMALTVLSGYLVEHTYNGYTSPKKLYVAMPFLCPFPTQSLFLF